MGENVTLDGLLKRIERNEAYIKIMNVMGRYAFWHTANMHQECAELFALETEGTWSEMQWGRYNGKEGILKLYPGLHHAIDGPKGHAGKMHMHPLTTPVIEVAEDCMTAKAVWISPGHETGSFIRTDHDDAFWCWMKYDCDFIKENSQWKIWHMRTPGIFMTKYDTPWTVVPEGGPEMSPFPEIYLPDEPPSKPNWEYKPGSIYPNDPPPPMPYELWANLSEDCKR
jgi:hypothetical protein